MGTPTRFTEVFRTHVVAEACQLPGRFISRRSKNILHK